MKISKRLGALETSTLISLPDPLILKEKRKQRQKQKQRKKEKEENNN